MGWIDNLIFSWKGYTPTIRASTPSGELSSSSASVSRAASSLAAYKKTAQLNTLTIQKTETTKLTKPYGLSWLHGLRGVR